MKTGGRIATLALLTIMLPWTTAKSRNHHTPNSMTVFFVGIKNTLKILLVAFRVVKAILKRLDNVEISSEKI